MPLRPSKRGDDERDEIDDEQPEAELQRGHDEAAEEGHAHVVGAQAETQHRHADEAADGRDEGERDDVVAVDVADGAALGRDDRPLRPRRDDDVLCPVDQPHESSPLAAATPPRRNDAT